MAIIATDEHDGVVVGVLFDDGTFRLNGGPIQPSTQATRDRAALLKADGNRTTLEQKTDAALTANDTFLALANPTAAQQLAQLKALTRECSAVIRLMRNKLDTTTGT